MSDSAATVAEQPKKRPPVVKSIEKLFRTKEEAQAEVPAGNKRLSPWKLSCSAGEAFVLAANESAAMAVFAKMALKVTAESGKSKKKAAGGKSKKAALKSQLAEIEAAISTGPQTPEQKAAIEKIRAIQSELAAGRQKRDDAAAPTPPAVPS